MGDVCRSLILVTFLSLSAAAGCSAAADNPAPGGGGAGGTGANGGSMSSTGGSLTTTGASTGGAGVGGGCTETKFVADPLPLDLLVMLDQSGSMLQDAGNGNTKWNTVKAALTAFVQARDSEGIGIGLQYFGIPQPLVAGCYQQTCTVDADCEATGCGQCLETSGVCQAPYNGDTDSCEGEDYAWAEVPIQPLPAVGPVIAGSLGMHAPGTNTPTEPALDGAIQYAKAWANAHPDHIVAVIFATDGDPSSCITDLDYINSLAADGFNTAPSIQTFVIGVGPSLVALDGIAAAGGTTEAYLVDFDPMAEEQFLDALNKIRKAAVPCIYDVPPPPSGETLDFGAVNVEYTPGNGDPAEKFPYVGSVADCPARGHGWYYDDPDRPTKILLCDGTCDLVQGDLQAAIEIVLGCLTIVP